MQAGTQKSTPHLEVSQSQTASHLKQKQPFPLPRPTTHTHPSTPSTHPHTTHLVEDLSAHHLQQRQQVTHILRVTLYRLEGGVRGGAVTHILRVTLYRLEK